MRRHSKSRQDGQEDKRRWSHLIISRRRHAMLTRAGRRTARARAKQDLREGREPPKDDPALHEYFD
ncbi:MAG: hypothetical protein FWD11_05140 [Micrococcales bacterium]|nr:hypothetical protein [Micrococcales bacterium]